MQYLHLIISVRGSASCAPCPIKSKLNRRLWSPTRMDVVCAFSLTPSAHPPSWPIRFQIGITMRARYRPHQRPLQLDPVPSIAMFDEHLVGEFNAVHADHLFSEIRFAFTPTLPRKFGDGVPVAHRAAGLAVFQMERRRRVAELTLKSTALEVVRCPTLKKPNN